MKKNVIYRLIFTALCVGSHCVMANDVMKYPKRTRPQEHRSEVYGNLDAKQAEMIADEIDKMMSEKRAVKTGDKLYGSQESKINKDSWESDKNDMSKSASQRVSGRRAK